MKQVGLVRQMPIAYNQHYVYVQQAPIPLSVALNQLVPLNIRILFKSHNLGYMCPFWAYNIQFQSLPQDKSNLNLFITLYLMVKLKICLNSSATSICRTVTHNHSMCGIHVKCVAYSLYHVL